MTTTRRQALIQELLDRLRGDLDAMERAQRDTVAGATSEHAKAEHAKDTRALEQTYLARGQAQRVEEMRAAIARVAAMPAHALAADAVASLGARVTIEDEDDAGERDGGDEGARGTLLWIAPAGGGLRLSGGEQVVTPASPLGRALMGKRAGDEVEIVLGGRTRIFAIRRVD